MQAMNRSGKVALVIGAGPAGLTAAYELVSRTSIRPIVFEASDSMGGLARTVVYKGNRMDIGGHRFFSRSDRVLRWWQQVLPLERVAEPTNEAARISYHGKAVSVQRQREGPDPKKDELVMLVRPRLSRILYRRQLFDYPISLSVSTLSKLGSKRAVRIFLSYLEARLFPIRGERSLEDFYINRFGRELYEAFFKDYTEKVWGTPCSEIGPEWGAQRVRGLTVGRAIANALLKGTDRLGGFFRQRQVETSLIEWFMYPKYGPGQMWEEVARKVERQGGVILRNHEVVSLVNERERVSAIVVRDKGTGRTKVWRGDFVFSTMPIRDLVAGFANLVPPEVSEIASGLAYRDFMTVGLLLRRMKAPGEAAGSTCLPDDWLYIQEPEVKVGRIQIFNNWSPYLLVNPDTVWLGLEYFVSEGDSLWQMDDSEFIEFAVEELARIDLIHKQDVLDAIVVRVPKAYPGYFGTYGRLPDLRRYTDKLTNLFLIGRNGMHRYNNQDHSMLTAMAAVDNIIAGRTDKGNLWEINTDEEYHEGG